MNKGDEKVRNWDKLLGLIKLVNKIDYIRKNC